MGLASTCCLELRRGRAGMALWFSPLWGSRAHSQVLLGPTGMWGGPSPHL